MFKISAVCIVLLASISLAAGPLEPQPDYVPFGRVNVGDSKKAKLLARFDDDLGVVAVARTEPGEVVLLGDSMWWNWLATNPKSDNAKLLRNLLSKPPSK